MSDILKVLPLKTLSCVWQKICQKYKLILEIPWINKKWKATSLKGKDSLKIKT